MASRLRWILFMLMAGLLMAGCNRPTPPTPTPTRAPAPKVAPTSRPTSAPATLPVPTASTPRKVADFDACAGVNNLGGAMGAAYNSPDSLKVYLDNILLAADGPPPTRRPPNTVTPAPTPSPSARAREIIVEDFSPQPYQGQQVYFFNRLEGDRGAINNSVMVWGRGQVTTTIAAGNTWGGGWLSLNHPMREESPINFSAVLPAPILPPYQSQITGITARIAAGTPGRVFRLEFKDHGQFRWTREISLNGGEQVLSSDLPALGEINELVWVLDRATSGDFVVLDSIAVTTTTQITDTATAAFVWSYGQLLSNWNPVTGLVRDKAKDASGEFDAVRLNGLPWIP